jgi:hypothetical protein
MKTLIGTAPERPEYEHTARTLHALAAKVRASLAAAGRLVSRKPDNPEGN